MQLQEFYKHTLGTTFLKSLLYNSEIPMISTASSGDYLIKDGIYIIENYIVKCTESGYYLPSLDKLNVVGNMHIGDIISGDYDSEPTRCALDKLQFYTFGDKVLNVTKRYVSNSDSYDSHTHKYVGDYLRAVRDLYRIDLMGLYNCFDYELLNNVYLSSTQIFLEKNNYYKVLAVPIKYNKTYSIFIDCKDATIMPMLMNSIGPVKYLGNNALLVDQYPEYFKPINIPSMSFKHPYLYKFDLEKIVTTEKRDNKVEEIVTYLDDTTRLELYQYQKYLYLLIQLPVKCDSSIVVLEGDFSSPSTYIADITQVNNVDSKVLTNNLYSDASLCSINDGKQYAYSQLLIEYLTHNVVTNRDTLDSNISMAQNLVGKKLKFESGVWTNKLRYAIYREYLKSPLKFDKRDKMGYLDSDTEKYLNWKSKRGDKK